MSTYMEIKERDALERKSKSWLFPMLKYRQARKDRAELLRIIEYERAYNRTERINKETELRRLEALKKELRDNIKRAIDHYQKFRDSLALSIGRRACNDLKLKIDEGIKILEGDQSCEKMDENKH